MSKVKIYSTPSCIYCNLAKEYFKQNSVSYEDFNVATDLEKRQEMVSKSGQMGVPVIDIDGQVIVGFNEEAISKMIGK